MSARVEPFLGPRPENFDHVQTTSARSVTITCCAVVGLTMFLRTLGRYALKVRNDTEYGGAAHFLGLDDVFNALAVVTFFGLAAAVLTAISRGMGTHIERVIWLHGTDGYDSYNTAIYVCAIFYNSTLGFVKLSVLALYRRVLIGIPSRTLIIVNWCVIGLVATNTTVNVLIAAFQCNPVALAFDSTLSGTCINTSAFYLGNAITGIITDTTVYLLAIPIVHPLQMDKKRKIGMMLTFLIGLFAVATSAIRLAFLPALLVNPDATWAMAVPMDWSVVEPMVGILVSSLPAIRSILYMFDPSFGIRSQNSHSFKSTADRTDAHIQLRDFHPQSEYNTTNVSTSKNTHDGDSEKGLIIQGHNIGITKTTDVEVSST